MDKNKMTLKELGLTVEQVAKHLRDRGMREEAIAMLMRTSTAMNMENWTLQRFNGHCAMMDYFQHCLAKYPSAPRDVPIKDILSSEEMETGWRIFLQAPMFTALEELRCVTEQ